MAAATARLEFYQTQVCWFPIAGCRPVMVNRALMSIAPAPPVWDSLRQQRRLRGSRRLQ
jgi:hypothetical protein